MGVKLNVFKDPYMDRARETEDLMSKFKDLMEEAKKKDQTKA